MTDREQIEHFYKLMIALRRLLNSLIAEYEQQHKLGKHGEGQAVTIGASDNIAGAV